MSTPGEPDQGKAAEAEQAEQAAKESAAAASESAAEQSAESTGTEPVGPSQDEPAPSQAEGTAAESTGVDKAGAEAAAVSEPVGDEPAAPAEVESTSGGSDPADATGAAAEGAEPTEAAPPEPTDRASRRRRGQRGPAAPATTAPAPTRRRDQKRSGEQVIVRAQARYVRSSARKARLVADGVRGKSVPEARAALAFHPRAVSEAWTKLLESAIANAENNHDLVGEDLRIHAIYADEGPTIKRFRPRAMGRATRIRKRTSHLTIQLTPKD